MVVNNQQMYATNPQTPGTPNSNNSQRIAYQIQPSNTQFAYTTSQSTQQSGQQQCIIQGYQMVPQQQFQNAPRVAVQSMPRVVQRLPPGYHQANMVYTNATAANANTRAQARPVYAHVITTQAQAPSGPLQQVIQQSGPQQPRTPQSAHISTPTTPVPNNQIPAQGSFYTIQTYPQNYPSNGQATGFVQQPKAQPPRPFNGNQPVNQQATGTFSLFNFRFRFIHI